MRLNYKFGSKELFAQISKREEEDLGDGKKLLVPYFWNARTKKHEKYAPSAYTDSGRAELSFIDWVTLEEYPELGLVERMISIHTERGEWHPDLEDPPALQPGDGPEDLLELPTLERGTTQDEYEEEAETIGEDGKKKRRKKGQGRSAPTELTVNYHHADTVSNTTVIKERRHKRHKRRHHEVEELLSEEEEEEEPIMELPGEGETETMMGLPIGDWDPEEDLLNEAPLQYIWPGELHSDVRGKLRKRGGGGGLLGDDKEEPIIIEEDDDKGLGGEEGPRYDRRDRVIPDDLTG